MTTTGTTENAEPGGGDPRENPRPETPAPGPGSAGHDRRGIAIGLAVLLACGALVGYGFLNSEEETGRRAAPTTEVTYEVLGEGTADISYLGAGGSGRADVARNVRLPWKETVRVPRDKPPIVSVTLGEKGGRAGCTLAIRGRHVQRSTASGKFGRATCTAELRGSDTTAAPGTLEVAE